MNNILKCAVFAGIVLYAGTAFAQRGALVGKEAPELTTQEWINSEEALSLKDLKGKIIFLDFTATW